MQQVVKIYKCVSNIFCPFSNALCSPSLMVVYCASDNFIVGSTSLFALSFFASFFKLAACSLESSSSSPSDYSEMKENGSFSNSFVMGHFLSQRFELLKQGLTKKVMVMFRHTYLQGSLTCLLLPTAGKCQKPYYILQSTVGQKLKNSDWF